MANHGGKREGAGRKKGYAALEAERQRVYVAERLATEFAPIVDKAIEQAKGGDKYAREWLTDRAYGKATQFIDHTTDGKELPQPIYGGASIKDTGHISDEKDISSKEED